MPVVVKKTCDQTIVEIYTCPPPGGAYVSYVGVNIGAGTGEFYESTDQDASPREHKFRTLDVQNLGDGARVFKETTTEVDTVVPKLRSIIAGSNVTVEELPDEIRISSTGGGGGGGTGSGAPPTTLVATSSEVCSARLNVPPYTGPTLTYTPVTDTPQALAGHLAVVVIYRDWSLFTQSSASAIPAGWSVLMPTNGTYRCGVYYKWLTTNDLTTTFTWILGEAGLNRACRVIFVYDNIDEDVPFFTTLPYWRWQEYIVCDVANHPNLASPIPCFTDQQHVLSITSVRRNDGNVPDNFADLYPIEIGDIVPQQRFDKFFVGGPSSDTFTVYHRVQTWVGNTLDDENLIPGETDASSFQDPSWVSEGCSVSRPVSWRSQLTGAGAGPMRHYFGRNLTLAAGETATFAVLVKSPSNNIRSDMHFYCVDPSSNERGISLDMGERILAEASSQDPLTDRNSVWQAVTWWGHNDGIPSWDGGWLIFWMIAPEAGTYSFRVGPGRHQSTNSFVFENIEPYSMYVRHALLRKGLRTPKMVITPEGAVSGVSYTMTTELPGAVGARYGFASSNYGQQFSVVLILCNLRFPKARFMPLLDANDANVRLVSTADNEQEISNPGISGDDSSTPVIADRIVYPTWEGLPGKYYMEFTSMSNTGSWFPYMQCGVVHPWADWTSQGIPNVSPSGYIYDGWIDSGGGSGGVPLAAGDVIGCAIDYDVGEVKFYKNNVLVKTMVLDVNYPVRPFVQLGDYGYVWRARMKAPFVYPIPDGFVEFDILGDITYNYGDSGVNLGDGAAVVIDDGNGPTGQYRTILAGQGIDVTQETQVVRIAAENPQSIRGAVFVSSTPLTITVAPVTIFFPRAATIKRIVLMGDAAGSASVDVKKTTLANAAGGAGGTSITNGDNPTVTSNFYSDKTSFTGWTTAIGTGEVLNISLASVSTFKRLVVQVIVEESLA